MAEYKISLVASAIRPQVWKSFFDSLKGNHYPIEVVFVGDVRPDFELPPFVNYIYATVKPSQCYEIGFIAAKGELVGWTADDAVYSHVNNNNLDILYDFYKSFNNRNIVVGQRPIEDNRDVFKNHYLFGKHPETPYMLPFGFMDRELFHELGGYDKRFVCGQAENDMVMRVYEIGGKVELCMDAYVQVHHTQVHQGARQEFRKWYPQDRVRLELCWVKEGLGAMGPGRSRMFNPTISKTRLFPFEPFPKEPEILQLSTKPCGKWDEGYCNAKKVSGKKGINI